MSLATAYPAAPRTLTAAPGLTSSHLSDERITTASPAAAPSNPVAPRRLHAVPNAAEARGFVLYVGLDEAKAAAFRFMDALQVVDISNNLGDAKSIVTHPATTTHRKLGRQGRAAVGMSSATVRISIGLEDVEDLREDFARALHAV